MSTIRHHHVEWHGGWIGHLWRSQKPLHGLRVAVLGELVGAHVLKVKCFYKQI